MADGPVYTNVDWDDYKALVVAYCELYSDDSGDTSYDTVLEALFNAAKRKADAYLNNPFEVLNPTIAFSGVVAGDYITVNDKTYTAQDSADEEELYFALGSTDSDTADNFCTYLNSTTLGGSYGAVGVAGVLATNASGTVMLTRRFGNADDIVVYSSDDERLMVRKVRTSIDVPECVIEWLCQFVKRNFDNRTALIQRSITGKQLEMWVSMKSEEAGMTTSYDLINHLRYPGGF